MLLMVIDGVKVTLVKENLQQKNISSIDSD